MKRIVTIILCVLLIGMSMTSSLAVVEIEDIPGGRNLLNLRTVYATERRSLGYSDRHYVSVTSGVTHTIVMDDDYVSHCTEDLDGFEYENYPSGFPGYVSYQHDDAHGRYYAEFVPDEGAINIFSIPVPLGPVISSYNVMIYEGDYASFPGFEPYVLDGFSYESSGTLSFNYDDRMTLEEIEALITATNPDGQVIDKTIVSDTYSSSDQLPGDYEIIFQATSNLIVRNYILNISIYDATPPVIHGPDQLSYELSDRPLIAEITDLYSATDNVDGDVDVEVILDTYTYASELKTYTIIFQATDSSGNESTKEVLVTLVDTTAPDLHGPMDMYIYTTDTPYTTTDILNAFEATDIVDGACDVSITNDGYSGTQVAGVYEVTLSSSDLLGNTMTRTIYIHVIDNRGPSFDTDELIIETTPTEMLASHEIVSAFTSHMASLSMKIEHTEIEYNEYDTNETESGSYYVYVSYDLDGARHTSRVLINVEETGWSFSPYYLFGIVPIIGVVAMMVFKKRPF